MIFPKNLVKILKKNKINFFSGVPDSVLKNFTEIIEKKKYDHIKAANEGAAISACIGNFLSNRKLARNIGTANFNNSEDWYKSIPKDVRPKKNQPFYHLLAENNEITYEAYVSEQNLLSDDSDQPIRHPLIEEIFTGKKGSSYFKPSN